MLRYRYIVILTRACLPCMDCHPEILRARRGIARRTIVVALIPVLVVAAMIGIRKWIGPGLPECKPADLAAARERWAAAGLADYDITIVLSGRQSGEIKVSVRDSRPTAMTRNGIQPKQERTWEPWTVPGMFDTVDTDLESTERPKEKYGNDVAGVMIRCRFDERFGYPKKYLHQIMGRHQDLEWEVTEFKPITE
ncbi:MAG: DUF6174 domain-containing protein [Planctomycetia bacterium]|nr:DUF6174 domain-containing protein [Planctomycetia bacterium]